MPELTQEEYDELIKKLRILSFQMQENQDSLQGGLTSRNIKSFRNTYVINAQDSLDATYPMYIHFNIISEMIKIVSVKVDFWIDNFRAYSEAGAATGASTETGLMRSSSVSSYQTLDVKPMWSINGGPHQEDVASVSKSVGLCNHRHYIGDHTHDAVYGIFEEDTSPTIKFYVSENAGVSYSSVFGGYTTDKSALDITSLITTKGSKLIKFTSDVRARLSVQIEIKLDIKAR